MINAINNQQNAPDLSGMQITDKSLHISSSESFVFKDIGNISEFSKTLYQSNLDLKSSSASQSGEEFNFDLAFSSKKKEKLKAEGFFNTDEKKLNVTLKYEFNKEVSINGKVKVKAFEAIIDIKAKIAQYSNQKSSGEGPDVINFVRRVINEIMKVSGSEWQELRRASFDKDDLKNVISLEDSKISDMVKSLITLALSVAQMQKIKKDEKTNEASMYKIEDPKDKEVIPDQFRDITSFNVSIKEKENEEDEADFSDLKKE